MSTRVLIVDDQPVIRQGLTAILEKESNIEIIGEAKDGETAILKVEALKPDVVLMDILMPGIGGVEATKIIRQRFSDVKILVLSMDDHDENITQALRYGAAGYILKQTSLEDLTLAIKVIDKGYTHLGPGLGEKIIELIPERDPKVIDILDQLTPREKEVVALIAQGISNQEIAEKLYISIKTVKNHITSILSRLNLRDRTQVAILYNSFHIRP